MANLLILDASSSLCSVTLLNGEQRYDLSETQPRRHAQRLLPMVDEVLQLAGLPKAELDGIAYARGPGSFTGIRIAVSVVQGIAMGLDIPVYGFSTLQMLAQQSAATREIGAGMKTASDGSQTAAESVRGVSDAVERTSDGAHRVQDAASRMNAGARKLQKVFGDFLNEVRTA